MGSFILNYFQLSVQKCDLAKNKGLQKQQRSSNILSLNNYLAILIKRANIMNAKHKTRNEFYHFAQKILNENHYH